jgi:ATP-dependent Lon protease
VETEIVVPDQIAVMTLPEVAFFPQALMPLHIFEPRYQLMLKQVLATHRIFAVAGLHPESDPSEERGQRIATAGIVRACNANPDGTSNLLLQGIARVECLGIVREEPYRMVQIKALASEVGPSEPTNQKLRDRLQRLITLKQQLGVSLPEGFDQFLRTVDDPETVVELAAVTLCDNPGLKQRLLETLNVTERLKIYGEALQADVATLTLERKLQGRLSDDDILNN